jgi:hypothetical protein
MTALVDVFAPAAKEPEPWDRAAVPPEAPFALQERAIEELLQEPPLVMPLLEAPVDFVLYEAWATPAETQAPDPLVEEFKPTADEWENVKEVLLPHPDARTLDENLHPVYRPEILERDAEGRDGGDWYTVATERTED